MGNSFERERRGISWRDQTLASISAPPIPLVVIFGLVFVLMYMASYSEYKARVERTTIGLKMLVFLLPVLLIFVVQLMIVGNRWFYNIRGSIRLVSGDSINDSSNYNEGGSSPWGLGLVVLLLLVLVYYHSSIQSGWFRTV